MSARITGNPVNLAASNELATTPKPSRAGSEFAQ
jgi:hypothetical protein